MNEIIDYVDAASCVSHIGGFNVGRLRSSTEACVALFQCIWGTVMSVTEADIQGVIKYRCRLSGRLTIKASTH
jgi:hypothetical protein